MGRKCCVENCKSGYDSCKEKVTIFRVPKDPERLEAWARAIARKHRSLGPNDGVCCKHFPEDMIMKRRYFAELGGEVLLDVPKKWTLAEDAIPCIFPSSSGGPSPAPKKRKPPVTRHSSSPPKARKKTATAGATCTPDEGPQELPRDLARNDDSRQTSSEADAAATYQHATVEGTPVAESTKSECPSPEVMTVAERRENTKGDCPSAKGTTVAERRESIKSYCRSAKDATVAETRKSIKSYCASAKYATVAEMRESTKSDCTSAKDTTVVERRESTKSKCPSAEDTTVDTIVMESRKGAKSNCPQVCLDPSNARLPSLAWNHHTLCQEGLHSFCFIEVGLASSGKPQFFKVLQVEQVKEAEFTLSTFARDHKVEIATIPRVCQLRNPDDWSVITAAIKDLNDLNLCPGEPQREKYVNVLLECGRVDTDGVWRHKRCPILQVRELQCSFCARLKDTLRIHKSRKEKREDPQRVRLALLNPSIRQEVDLLRRQRIACYRSKMQLLKTKEKLTAELKSCREKLKHLMKNSRHRTLQVVNLSEVQQMPVTEYVS
ncbi:unnamed protein product, partial [Ixodes hexagonus]